MSLAITLGFERLLLERDRARLRAVVGAGHTNMHGTGHGGFVYALADEAFALASNSGDADAVALSVNMDYFRAVRPGDELVAEATPEHVGRRVATYRVEVRSGGETVALFTGTVYRRPHDRGGDGAGERASAPRPAHENRDPTPSSEER